MTAKLRFENRNNSADVLEVFRTDTEVAKPGVDKIIATLAGNATEYKDTTAVIGQTYYYVTAASLAGRPETRIYGRPFKITVRSDRGPGPQEIIVGNERLGYFGLVDRSLLPSVNNFKIFADSAQVHTGWMKIIRKGKILYMPNFALVGVPAISSFNQAGLRSGFPNSKKPASYPFGFFNDNIATINGYNFHTRLAYGLPDEWTPAAGVPSALPGVDSEFFEILSFCQTNLNRAGLKVPNVSMFSSQTNTQTGNVFAEIASTSNTSMAFGVQNGTTASGSIYGAVWADNKLNQTFTVGGLSGGSSISALMLFELIED